MDIEESKKIIKEISKVYKSNAVLQVYDDISRDESIENYKAIETVLAELDNQERIINAMAEYIASLDIDEDICKKRTEDCYADIYDDKTCIDCVKQYYEKKVSEE